MRKCRSRVTRFIRSLPPSGRRRRRDIHGLSRFVEAASHTELDILDDSFKRVVVDRARRRHGHVSNSCHAGNDDSQLGGLQHPASTAAMIQTVQSQNIVIVNKLAQM